MLNTGTQIRFPEASAGGSANAWPLQKGNLGELSVPELEPEPEPEPEKGELFLCFFLFLLPVQCAELYSVLCVMLLCAYSCAYSLVLLEYLLPSPSSKNMRSTTHGVVH